MRHRSRTRDSVRFVFSAVPVVLAPLAAAGLARAQEPCAAFIHLEDGRFMEGNVPYAMEGPNFPMAVAGVQSQPSVDPPWEYFLAPYDSFRPDGSAVCNGPSTASCCQSEATCLGDLQYDIDALVAMGANSVRLLPPYMKWHTSDPTHHTPYLQCVTSSVPVASSQPCEMDLMDPYQRERALDLFEDQIDLLGDNGIRSILVTGRPEGGNQYAALEYGRWLEDLADRLADNPYLIAYDPMNEPLYQFDAATSGYACSPDDEPGNCKDVAIAASQGWFQHLTSKDPNHLVTIGLGGVGSVFMWDPAILWDHFTSYHVYPFPGGTWDDPGPGGPAGGPPFPAAAPVSGANGPEKDIYYGALNGCGVRCPFLGEYDGANCHVATGPVGAAGFVQEGELDYPYFTSGNPCPVGTDTGAACQVASYDPGRDEPFVLQQPLYYVVSQNGGCPPGTTFDGANCLAFSGPPGAQPFLWTDPSGSTGFYYAYLSQTHHCDPPAVDDTASCYLGPVPAGWSPFHLTRPLYYVLPAACGKKKPVYFGEAGFSTYPYPTGSPDFWASSAASSAPPELQQLRNQCNYVEGGPQIDLVTVGGESLEAEDGVVTTPAVVLSCTGCSKGETVEMRAGGQLDLHPSGDEQGCAPITMGYRSNRETRIWINMAGRAPRRVTLPSTNSVWTQTSLDLDLPPGTDTITITVPHDAANGDSVQEGEFLVGDGASWPGLVPYGQKCGFQGIHYWLYGSTTHWGSCGGSPLNALWYEVSVAPVPPSPQDEIELRLTTAAETLRDQVDFLAPWTGKCEEPADFHLAASREIGPLPVHAYEGTVTATDGTPLANVPVRAWLNECGVWRSLIRTHTDRNGHYEMNTDFPLAAVQASHFGYRTAHTYAQSGSTTIPTIALKEMAALPGIPTPAPPLVACRGVDGWVPQ